MPLFVGAALRREAKAVPGVLCTFQFEALPGSGKAARPSGSAAACDEKGMKAAALHAWLFPAALADPLASWLCPERLAHS